MELEDKLANLSHYYNQETYLLLTAAQLQKDLKLFNLDFTLAPEGPVNQTTLIQALEPIVEDLINTNREKLVQLFYRIDVAESKIGNALGLATLKESTLQICNEIINRELKKVIIKKHYKQSK